MSLGQLMPMRFITMIGHLVLLGVILWDRDLNVRACISNFEFSQSEYRSKDIELIVGFSLAIALLFIELIGFLSGISMFAPMHSLFSLIAHSSACISLSYFMTDVWDCTLYWWIFAFCSVLPALSEVRNMISVFIFKKLP